MKRSMWKIPALIIVVAASAMMIECEIKENVNVMESGIASASEVGNPAVEDTAEEIVVPEVRMEVMPVRAIKVYESGGTTHWFSGVSDLEENMELSFGVAGTVSRVSVGQGKKILYETVVARLESGDLKNKIEELEAALVQARIEAKKAADNLKRVESSVESSQQYLEKLRAAKAAARNAKTSIRNYKKEIQNANLKLGRHEIRVFLRGTLTSVNIKAGDRVEAGQTAAVFKLDMPMEVTVNLPAVLIGQLGVNSKGKVRFTSKKGGVYPVKVVKVGEVTPGPDGTFPVTVRLRHYYSYLHSGREAEAAFRFDYKIYKRRFLLPPDSVGKSGGGGSYVYVVVPSESEENYGALERRSVETAGISPMGRAVTKGLSDGEMVVVHGIYRLKDGMKVRYK